MAEMTENDLLAQIAEAESDAVAFNGEFMGDNEKLLKQYLGRPYGDEVEGRSRVVSTDMSDVVESDMPSLARVFLGSGNVVTFQPNTDNEAEIQEAEDKTKYINWIVRNQPDSFATIHGWLKDAEIQKMGVLKYFIEDTLETEEVKYTGVDAEELEGIMDSLRGEDVSKVEIIGQSQDEVSGQFDIEFKVTKGEQKVCIVNVPTESFLISRNSSGLEDAEMVGDRMLKTRGDLIAEGFDRDLINQLPSFETDKLNQSTMKQIRFRDEGGDFDSTISNWASQEVEIIDMSIRIDFDGDGIAERRHIVKSGNHVLVNEQFEHVPYAMISTVLMPHKAIGRSRAELTQSNQRVKTVVLRQTLDNLYFVNNARNVVSDQVNLDDMLTVRPNGIVRTEGNVQEAVFPLVTEYIGDKSLQIIQYLDFARAQSTGTLMASQGLDADALATETATRFQGVQDEGTAKIELVARVIAETGFRKLYEGLAWLTSRFQDTETEFRVLGKAMKVNPSGWKYKHHVESNVGLGAGDNDQLVGALQGIYGIQQQLKMQGSSLTDEKDIYNTLDRITKGLGLPNVDEFFNNPEEPDELLRAENEILNKALLEAQQMVQQLQDPLSKAAEITAQGKLIEAQGKRELDVATMLQDAKEFQEEMKLEVAKLKEDARQANMKTATDLTKLEVETGVNVPGSSV